MTGGSAAEVPGTGGWEGGLAIFYPANFWAGLAMLPGRSEQPKSAASQRLAVLHPVDRADFLLEQGDIEGAAVWWTILGAIKEPQRAIEPEEAVN